MKIGDLDPTIMIEEIMARWLEHMRNTKAVPMLILGMTPEEKVSIGFPLKHLEDPEKQIRHLQTTIEILELVIAEMRHLADRN